MSPDLCPWLGIFQDRETRYLQPSEAHICYAQEHRRGVGLDQQRQFCLTAEHSACPFYKESSASLVPATLLAIEKAEETETEQATTPFPWLRAALWGIAILALAAAALYYGATLLTPTPLLPTTTVVHDPSPTPSTTPSPLHPTPTFEFTEPTATLTPYPQGSIHTLSPEAGAAGWVGSDEDRGNHFGDSFLYAGVFDDIIYHGAFQFDLSQIPRGATIHYAALELSGLDASRLGESGVWEVRLLANDADKDWVRQTFQDLHNATVEWSLTPALAASELAPRQTYTFILPQEQLRSLEQRLLDENYTLSFRIDGPYASENSVFAWDGGQGSASQGKSPILILSVGAPPLTPIPSGTPPFVVVTSTPTPANILTAAAQVQTATAVAATTGQPTPTSIYEWTATPVQVVTNTPTPANRATADWRKAVITAIALTTGTLTPTPEYILTATSTPIAIPEVELTPTLPPQSTLALPAELRGRILFLSDRAGSNDPWVMDADGKNVALLTAPWPYEIAASRENLSPDGSRIVYVGQSNRQPALLVETIETDQKRAIAVFETGRPSSPVWSPAGNRIAFELSASGSTQIWLVNADGSGLRQLTVEAWGDAHHPTFSPDGQRLAYAGTTPDGRGQIWTIASNGAGRVNISNNTHSEWDPVWVK